MTLSTMPAEAKAFAEAARGFMPPDEGVALWRAALDAPAGPMLEVGSYCGKSACYLGAAIKQRGDATLFCVDHHRGSEENQEGWEWHEPDLVDLSVGIMDTLPHFRRTIYDAGLESHVVALVGDSPAIAAVWSTPLALLFIDGGHGTEPAHLDYEGWTPKLVTGGTLLIHDVFPNPDDGGRPPYEIYLRAIDDGFVETEVVGSLRTLRAP